MKTLAQLIADLCPNGVPFKKLGEIAQIGTGSSNRQDADPNGDYPFFVRSKDIFKNKKYEFDEEAILIPGEGGVGDIFHYFKGKYALHQRTYRIHITKPFINTKFVYYYMYANFKLFIKMHAVNGTVASIRKPMIEDFEIPVPPIEVQEKIVEILDKFTALTVELQAELQERQRQYEYYRNRLLSFGGSDNIHSELIDTQTLTPPHYKFLKMSEIGIFLGGLSGKSKADFTDGNATLISYMNVFSNIALKTDVQDSVKIGPNEKQNFLQYGDVIFTGSSETPEESGMTSVLCEHPKEKLYLNSFCFIFRLNNLSLFYPDYLKHLFRSKFMRNQITKTANGVTRFNISKKLLGDVLIPLVPMEEQIEVSKILDRFEALCSDLSAGLPAEIEARQKQYEYYRNRLLSFTRMAN